MKTYLDTVNGHYLENPDYIEAAWILLPSRPDYNHLWDAVAQAWLPIPPDPFAYKTKRAAEYPPYVDYIDAQVKKASLDSAIKAAGIAQEAEYIAACLAVKGKYPKPGLGSF